MGYSKLIIILCSQKNTLRYFINHYPAPLTGYDNLFQISPGEVLEFRNKKILKKNTGIFKEGETIIFFLRKMMLNL